MTHDESSIPTPGRIRVPVGYGIDPTVTAGMLPWSYVTEHLEKAKNYWVGTTRPDGRPHAIPVWGLWLDNAVYFSTDPTSRKGRNLAANPELVIHLESGDEVVILDGRAERVTDAAVLARFVDAYEVKYKFRMDPTDAAYGVYRVRPRVVQAWREHDYPVSSTRWRFPI